jgi:hypothetical protein
LSARHAGILAAALVLLAATVLRARRAAK